MTVSTVPAAARGLRTALATALSPTLVGYGPPQTDAEAGERVDVFFSPTEEPAVTVTAEWAAIGDQSQEEEYGIPCALVVWSGDTDTDSIEARIDRAYELLAACATAIGADYTLGGAVRVAHISSHTGVVEDARVTVTFTVSVEARTPS